VFPTLHLLKQMAANSNSRFGLQDTTNKKHLKKIKKEGW
jgi:hypothetical protein